MRNYQKCTKQQLIEIIQRNNLQFDKTTQDYQIRIDELKSEIEGTKQEVKFHSDGAKCKDIVLDKALQALDIFKAINFPEDEVNYTEINSVAVKQRSAEEIFVDYLISILE